MVRQRDVLIRAGVYYPPKTASANHILNLRRPDWSAEPVLEQIRAAQDLGCTRIIFSGEAISILNAGEIAALRACLKDHQLRFVFSFRHWADYLPSRWSTYSLRRDSQPFPAYIKAVQEAFPKHIDLQFHQLADRFKAGHAHFRAVSYDNAMAEGGSPVLALFQALDIPEDLANLLQQKSRAENTRRPWDQVELMRLLNGVVAQYLGLNQDDLCHSIGTFGVGNIPFVLDRRLEELPAEISEPLLERIRENRKTRRLDPNDIWLEQLNDMFQARCAETFTNRVDGRIFAAPKASETECTDLTWSRDVPERIARHLIAQPFVQALQHQ